MIYEVVFNLCELENNPFYPKIEIDLQRFMEQSKVTLKMINQKMLWLNFLQLSFNSVHNFVNQTVILECIVIFD